MTATAASPDAGSIRSTEGRLAIGIVGASVSTFFAITYVASIAGYILLPTIPVTHTALALFLPGFTHLDWRTLLMGLAGSVMWGWYVAAVFCPIYNFYARQSRQ